jgi:hypothetical protein
VSNYDSTFAGHRAHLDTTINEGGAELPLCPNLTAGERSDAAVITCQNIASLVLVDYWAAQQHRPT